MKVKITESYFNKYYFLEKSEQSPVNRDDEIFSCTIDHCNRSFKRKDNLTAHIKSVHEKLKKLCMFCKKKYHPSSLKRHQESNECHKKFLRELYSVFWNISLNIIFQLNQIISEHINDAIIIFFHRLWIIIGNIHCTKYRTNVGTFQLELP